jgi:hypothetical protein
MIAPLFLGVLLPDGVKITLQVFGFLKIKLELPPVQT